MPDARPPGMLDGARRRAGLVLWIEQLWPRLLPALAVPGGYALLALLTVPQRLPVWLHGLFLVAGLLATILLARRGLRTIASPAIALRDRRIEHVSRLSHRPLETLRDTPALAFADVGSSARLWQAHLDRTRSGLGGLSSGRPRLSLQGRDRLGLAWAGVAALALALVLSGRDAPLRLASGFWPGVALPLGPRPSLQAWITLPDYAGGAPVFLTDPAGRYTVPVGSRLTVSLTGSDATPGPVLGASFRRLSERSWSLDHVLDRATDQDGRSVGVVEGGYRLSNWRVVVQAVAKPDVVWTAPPGPDAEIPSRTRLPWSVAHRYGVQSLTAEIRLADAGADGRVLRVPIPLSGMPTKAKGIATPDLSSDPWAGAAVVAHLVATDGSGQTASSADARFTMPERRFRNPLARAVLDLRRRLATGRETATATADDLQALGDTPGAFSSDSSLYLNLSSTASLLRLPTGTDRDAEAVDRLWTLALALEDGLHNDRDGARAALDVRAAQDRLSAQIERMRQLGKAGQSEPELAELKARIAALSAAIARRMQAMAAQAARQHMPMPQVPDAALLGGQDLGRMLKSLQDQAANGHADDAMRALARMQAMLDHMRMATPQDLQSAQQQAEANAQARDQMAAVQDLVKRQTALLDRAQDREARGQQAAAQAQPPAQPGLETDGEDSQTRDNGGQAPDAATRALLERLGIPFGANDPTQGAPDRKPADQGPTSNQAEAEAKARDTARQAARAAGDGTDRTADGHAQSVLRRALDELSTEFGALTGKKAEQLGAASKAMQAARDALAQGKDAEAASAQGKALAALSQGSDQMRQAMRGSGGGLALLPGGNADGAQGTDDEPEGAGPDDRSGDEQDGPRDPLGRHVASGHAGMDDGDETHVPGQDNSARSRQIQQELRRRDSDRTRPQPELDYLDRLLKAF